MVGTLRAEHGDSGLRFFNIEPGMVVTELMKASGIDEAVLAQFKPTRAASVAAVVTWLAENEPSDSWKRERCMRAPAMAEELGLLDAPSFIESGD